MGKIRNAMTTLVPESPVSTKSLSSPPRSISDTAMDSDLLELGKAVEATREKNAAPPDYEDVQRDPEFWSDMLGFWR